MSPTLTFIAVLCAYVYGFIGGMIFKADPVFFLFGLAVVGVAAGWAVWS